MPIYKLVEIAGQCCAYLQARGNNRSVLCRKAYCGGHGQSESYLTLRPRSGGAALLRLNLAGTQPFIILFGIKASIKPFLFVTLEGHFAAAPRNYKAFVPLGYGVSLAQRRSDWQNLAVRKL